LQLASYWFTKWRRFGSPLPCSGAGRFLLLYGATRRRRFGFLYEGTSKWL